MITETRGAPADTQNSFGFLMLCTITLHILFYSAAKFINPFQENNIIIHHQLGSPNVINDHFE